MLLLVLLLAQTYTVQYRVYQEEPIFKSLYFFKYWTFLVNFKIRRTHEICPYNNQTLPICYEQVWSHYSHWCCYATNTGNHVNLTNPLSSYLFELLVMNSCELKHSGIWLLCLMHLGFVQSGQRNIQWHVNTSHRHMHHCNYWKKPQATDAASRHSQP